MKTKLLKNEEDILFYAWALTLFSFFSWTWCLTEGVSSPSQNTCSCRSLCDDWLLFSPAQGSAGKNSKPNTRPNHSTWNVFYVAPPKTVDPVVVVFLRKSNSCSNFNLKISDLNDLWNCLFKMQWWGFSQAVNVSRIWILDKLRLCKENHLFCQTQLNRLSNYPFSSSDLLKTSKKQEQTIA